MDILNTGFLRVLKTRHFRFQRFTGRVDPKIDFSQLIRLFQEAFQQVYFLELEDRDAP